MTPQNKFTKSFQELHVFLKDEKQKEYSIIGIFYNTPQISDHWLS